PGPHLRSALRIEPALHRPRPPRRAPDLASLTLTGPRVFRRTDIFLDLFPPASAVFVMPEIQISFAPHRLDAIPATDHHSAHRSMLNPRTRYRYLTITERWANLLPRPIHRFKGASSSPTSSRCP